MPAGQGETGRALSALRVSRRQEILAKRSAYAASWGSVTAAPRLPTVRPEWEWKRTVRLRRWVEMPLPTMQSIMATSSSKTRRLQPRKARRQAPSGRQGEPVRRGCFRGRSRHDRKLACRRAVAHGAKDSRGASFQGRPQSDDPPPEQNADRHREQDAVALSPSAGREHRLYAAAIGQRRLARDHASTPSGQAMALIGKGAAGRCRATSQGREKEGRLQ